MERWRSSSTKILYKTRLPPRVNRSFVLNSLNLLIHLNKQRLTLGLLFFWAPPTITMEDSSERDSTAFWSGIVWKVRDTVKVQGWRGSRWSLIRRCKWIVARRPSSWKNFMWTSAPPIHPEWRANDNLREEYTCYCCRISVGPPKKIKIRALLYPIVIFLFK